MEKGFEPIGLENIKVSEWLKMDNDNIVIYLDDSVENSYKILLLKKSYFLNPNKNDIYKQCFIENGTLNLKNTYNNKENYSNIGFYLDKYKMIDNKILINNLKSKSRVFKLFNLSSNNFISKDLLELSQISLGNKPVNKKLSNEELKIFLKQKKKNIPYNEDIYFNEVLSETLKSYTGSSFSCMNRYLRDTENFFNSDYFKNNCIRNSYLNKDYINVNDYLKEHLHAQSTLKSKKDILDYLLKLDDVEEKYKTSLVKSSKTKIDTFFNKWIQLQHAKIDRDNLVNCKKNIKEKIDNLDKCFTDYAPRMQEPKSNRYFYRGMNNTYDGLNFVGDTIVNKSFTSISTDPNVPYIDQFWNEYTECCYYRFKISKGVPYINMVTTTMHKHESEILLPRDLKFTLYNRTLHTRDNGDEHTIYDILVEKINETQYVKDTGCNSYDLLGMTVMSETKIEPKLQISKKDDIEKHLEPVKDKKPRCPNGTRRNKKTGKCEPKNKKLNEDHLKVITPMIKSNPLRINDVLENLITINGHGGFNPEKIKVPDWCQIMIPHVNGLDSDYTTPDASKVKLFEEDLYENKHFNYKEGWRLYLPGDLINNLAISIFHDASSCEEINEYHTLQKPLTAKCKNQGNFNKFCPLYCTKYVDGDYDYITYKNKRKLKIKACSGYFLKDLFDNLLNQLSKLNNEDKKHISPNFDKPILLIPFTCNAKHGSQTNGFDTDNETHLNDIYQKLYDERFKTIPDTKKIEPVKKINVKKKTKSVKKIDDKKNTIKNLCKGYSKSKPPKCNDQKGCEWTVLGYKNGTKLASGCWEKGKPLPFPQEKTGGNKTKKKSKNS